MIFQGENARPIRKCQRYFLINNMSDYDKIMLVGIYVHGIWRTGILLVEIRCDGIHLSVFEVE